MHEETLSTQLTVALSWTKDFSKSLFQLLDPTNCNYSLTWLMRSRTEIAFAMKQTSPWRRSGTAEHSEIYSAHFSQKVSYFATRPSFNSCISMMISRSSDERASFMRSSMSSSLASLVSLLLRLDQWQVEWSVQSTMPPALQDPSYIAPSTVMLLVGG